MPISNFALIMKLGFLQKLSWIFSSMLIIVTAYFSWNINRNTKNLHDYFLLRLYLFQLCHILLEISTDTRNTQLKIIVYSLENWSFAIGLFIIMVNHDNRLYLTIVLEVIIYIPNLDKKNGWFNVFQNA